MTDLLNVDDAIKQVLQEFKRLPSENISLAMALGRWLAEDVIASHNLPPFANSGVDGYAVHAADSRAGTEVSLRVVDDILAGSVPSKAIFPGEAARIMTGAAIPEGADAVVPVEDTSSNWLSNRDAEIPPSIIISRALSPGENIRPAGESVRQGQRVLPCGRRLRPADIGILASLGQATVNVISKPVVVIISSGDELLDLHQAHQPGKIHDSNSYALAAQIEQAGGIAIRLPIVPDQIDAIRAAFTQAIEMRPQIILSSAGVSVGVVDLIRNMLDELGTVSFWRVNLRPGKPLAFGKLGDIPFFGLPGNPVSAMVTFEVFVRPAIATMLGAPTDPNTIYASVAHDLESDGRRSYLRVKLKTEGNQVTASITGTQSSGALFSLVEADGLLIIPEGIHKVEKGTVLPVQLL